jgi:hypothetical protein
MNSKQARTLSAVFETPTRSDIRWGDIESLFLALGGTLKEGRGSRVRVYLNKSFANFHRPHPSGITKKYAVEETRRLLQTEGFEP